MSAQEVIEQIKALPPPDRAKVLEFVHQLETEVPFVGKAIQYATSKQAKAAGDKVVQQYEQVFRKLSQ
jgi:hypothetical protein